MIGTNWAVFLAAALLGGWTAVNQISPAICKWQSSPPQRWKGESASLASGLAGDLLTPVITWARAAVVIRLVFPVLFHPPHPPTTLLSSTLCFFLLLGALTPPGKVTWCLRSFVWGVLAFALAFTIVLKVETLPFVQCQYLWLETANRLSLNVAIFLWKNTWISVTVIGY